MESAKISTLNKKLTAANEILVTTNKELIMRDPSLVKAIEEISKALKDKKSPDMSKLKRMVVGKTVLQVILCIVSSGLWEKIS